MSRRLLAAVALLVALAALAPSAHAARVWLQYDHTDPAVPGGDEKFDDSVPTTDVYVLHVRDDGAEANRIAIVAHGRVRDDGAPLVPGDGCAGVAPDGWVTCTPTPTAPGNAVRYTHAVEAGPGDDVLTVGADAVGGAADLGDGDDQAQIAGRWAVAGGAGADRLRAPERPLSRFITKPADWGGASWDGGPGPDRVSGPGALVTYAGRTAGVRVTPGEGDADDGEPGEGDEVAGDVGPLVGGAGGDELHRALGDLFGGPGDDALYAAGDGPVFLDGGEGNDALHGGPAGERLVGGPGDDVLEGGDGDDALIEGAGADRVDGGPGDDALDDYEPDGAPDVYVGGPGDDRFAERTLPTAPPLRVTLGAGADDGPAGEHDDVGDGWERVAILRGTLVGTDAPEGLAVDQGGVLDGRGGDDLLSGHASVTGGAGRDTIQVYGGRVHARGGGRDRVECSGRGIRVTADRADRVLGCAGRPELTLASLGTPLPLDDRTRLHPHLRCYGPQVCEGSLRLVAGGGRTVARARFSTDDGSGAIGGDSTPVLVVRRPRATRGTRCATATLVARMRVAGSRRVVTQRLPMGRCAWR